MSEKQPEAKVENIVASITLNKRLDLNYLAETLERCKYIPEQFPGLVYYLDKPKATFLVFETGKLVCTGTTSEEALYKAVNKLVKLFKKLGINITKEPEVKVQNIVASGDLHAKLNLDEAVITLENILYEPEQFPGAILRFRNPRVVFLLFSTGKIVCTGAKSEEQVREAVNALYKELKELGLI
ncbi:MAG: TATA-box-binding protein [Candidatus Asgardarchaeia archaeon]